MNVSGITCPDMSQLINDAVAAGWVACATKSNHTRGVIEWPDSGERVTYSTTPRGGTWKSRANEIFRISGIDLRRKGAKPNVAKAKKANPRAAEIADATAEAERLRRIAGIQAATRKSERERVRRVVIDRERELSQIASLMRPGPGR